MWGEFPEWAVWTPGVSPSPCGSCSFTLDCVHSLGVYLPRGKALETAPLPFVPQTWESGVSAGGGGSWGS